MDLQNLSIGDVVTVTATVLSPIDRDGDYHVVLPNGHRQWLHHSGITSATKKALEVNDRVNIHGTTSNPGEILAIVGQRAWVKWDNGNESTYALDMLRRQPA